MSKLDPVRLSPAFKNYIWGGERLRTEFHKKTDLDRVAESWELSAHVDGESVVASGEYAGLTLTRYVERAGREILGTSCAKYDRFPVLIKFIDAAKDLSVQVHPTDAYALAAEGEYGKTEMWYVLDCTDGASLYYGFSRDVTREEYESAIKAGRLTDLLNKVKVKRGDVFFIPAGTVHAIGAGLLICEIQENSNVTYRVYDYERRDKNGDLRPLHIEKALEVSDLKKAPARPPVANGDDALLAECEYFTVRRLRIRSESLVRIDRSSFLSLIVTEGSGVLKLGNAEMALTRGDSIFVPAQDGDAKIIGNCELILTRIN